MRKLKSRRIILMQMTCLFLFSSINTLAQDSNTDFEQIKKIFFQQEEDWNRGDIDAFMKAYWNSEELQFGGVNGITWGWQQTLESYKRGYPDRESMGKLSFQIKDMTQHSEEVVSLTGSWVLERLNDRPGGYFLLIWKMINGEWKIVVDHTSQKLSSQVSAPSFQTLDFIKSISGKRTLAGQHNKEPNADPDKWTRFIKENTGKYPALWSGDFLFQQDNIDNRWKMIHEAKKQWDHGAVINLMWHACPPDEGEPCGWDPGLLNAQLTDEQWEELITDGTPLNETWKARMDDIVVYLQYLEDNGVELLFRPFHEMNQGLFWWGGRPGPDGTARLFQITHDYFTSIKGLSNLIWVWDMQDMSRDFELYNPGSGYWDIFGFDIYDQGYDISWYNYILPLVGDKPMAIGECSKLPTPEILGEQPRWVFFMPWAELVKEANSKEQIIEIYNNPAVITRDEMPGWK
jgi:mannan endo-1,4-beta-mannosidase